MSFSCGLGPLWGMDSDQSNRYWRFLLSVIAMELRHLQALVAVAEHGSFSAAADFLGTVQSNVSSHVARLERELGVELVDRAAGRLTAEGEVVVGRAYRVLGEVEALAADVSALRAEVTGTVRAGMIGTIARWLVPLLLADISTRHPKLKLTVADGTTTALEPQLAAGRLDLAVLTAPIPGRDVSLEPLLEEQLVLVLPIDGDPLDGAARVGLSDIAQLELLLPAPGTPFRAELDAAVRPTGLRLRPRAEVDGVQLIASLAFEGHGPAILPASAVPPHLRDRFRAVAVEGLAPRRVGLALRTRSMPAAPARAVIASLRRLSTAAEQLPEGIRPIVPEALARAEGSLRTLGVPND